MEVEAKDMEVSFVPVDLAEIVPVSDLLTTTIFEFFVVGHSLPLSQKVIEDRGFKKNEAQQNCHMFVFHAGHSPSIQSRAGQSRAPPLMIVVLCFSLAKENPQSESPRGQVRPGCDGA